MRILPHKWKLKRDAWTGVWPVFQDNMNPSTRWRANLPLLRIVGDIAFGLLKCVEEVRLEHPFHANVPVAIASRIRFRHSKKRVQSIKKYLDHHDSQSRS